MQLNRPPNQYSHSVINLSPQQIDVHIDEIVIEGLEGLDGSRIGAVVERELSRLLGKKGLPSNWNQNGQAARLTSRIRVAPNEKTDIVGAQIARAVYEGWNR